MKYNQHQEDLTIAIILLLSAMIQLTALNKYD